MKATTKIGIARKGVSGIAGTGYAAGKLVGTSKTGGRAAKRGARRSLTGSRGGPETRKAPIALGVAAGAAGAYFLDPQNGRRRRHILRDKSLKQMRRSGAEAQRKADYAAGVATGAVKGRTSSPRDPAELNDPALARKVETEIFRDRQAPKGKVDVNVENGVVFLRGEVASAGEADDLTRSAREVEGVGEVESLLHLPGDAPRSKDGHGQPE